MSANILTLEEARKAKYKELKNSEEDSHLADKLKDLEADFDKGKEKLDEGDEYWNSYWKEYRESNDADSLEKSLRAYLESDNLLGGGLRHAELMRVSTDEEQSWQRLARHSYSQTFAISQYAKVKDAVESNRDADDADAIRHFLVALALRSHESYHIHDQHKNMKGIVHKNMARLAEPQYELFGSDPKRLARFAEVAEEFDPSEDDFEDIKHFRLSGATMDEIRGEVKKQGKQISFQLVMKGWSPKYDIDGLRTIPILGANPGSGLFLGHQNTATI